MHQSCHQPHHFITRKRNLQQEPHMSKLIQSGFYKGPSRPGSIWKTITIILLTSILLAHPARAEVDFDYLHGSDLTVGIGARAISMSGAFTAVADDASAVFWNPAGLAQLKDNQIYLSGDYPGGFSSAGIAYRPAFKALQHRQLAIGLAIVNRLRFKGDSGDDVWDEYASNLASLAMVDLGDDFSGEIESQTMDVRFSLALAPFASNRFHLGINFVHLD
jgi:hypothetical protein